MALLMGFKLAQMGLNAYAESQKGKVDGTTQSSTYTKTGDFKNAGLWNRTAAGFDEQKHDIDIMSNNANLASMGATAVGALSTMASMAPDKPKRPGDPPSATGDGSNENLTLETQAELNDVSLASAGIENTYDPMATQAEAMSKEFNFEQEDEKWDFLNPKPYQSTGTSGIFNRKISI